MNRNDMSFLIGVLLGDGYLTRLKNGTIRLGIRHSTEQKDYLLYKAQRLNAMFHKSNKVRDIDNNGYPGCEYILTSQNILSPLYDLFYPNGKKHIAKEEILHKLTAESLALWWMDDGSLYMKRRNGKINAREGVLSTYVSLEDNIKIVGFLKESWGIDFKPVRSKNKYRLRLNTSGLKKFIPIINEHMHDSLSNKVDMQYPTASSPSTLAL